MPAGVVSVSSRKAAGVLQIVNQIWSTGMPLDLKCIIHAVSGSVGNPDSLASSTSCASFESVAASKTP